MMSPMGMWRRWRNGRAAPLHWVTVYDQFGQEMGLSQPFRGRTNMTTLVFRPVTEQCQATTWRVFDHTGTELRRGHMVPVQHLKRYERPVLPPLAVTVRD